MGWSYDSSKLDVPLNQVRFLIGDTIEGAALIEDDDEIQFCLTQKNNNIYLAGAFALRRGSARLLRELKLIANKGGLEDDTMAQSQELLKRAAELESEAVKAGGVSFYFGGISKADVQTREQDDDRVDPAVTVDSFEPNSVPVSEIPDTIWRW